MPIKLSKVKSQINSLYIIYSRFKERITSISNGNFRTLKPLLASGVMLLLAIFSVILNALPTYAAITLSVSSTDEAFNLLPGKFNSSNPVNISVSTDDDGGYNLSISGPENNILLKSGTTNVGLNSISDDKLSTNFGNNEFGIKYCKSTNTTCINSETYISAPGNDLLQIDKTTDSNSATYALSVGAKVDVSAKDGDEYSGNFVIFASANATSYSINYVDPQGSWPASTTGSTTGTKINLSSVTPTKGGYTFNGWCSVYTNDGTCSGNTYQPGEEYELSNGAITNLYAMWGEPLYMQNVGTWGSEVTTGSTVTAVDSRDGKEYTVGRLADGKLWMLDNLAFDGTSGDGTSYIEMNSANTNITGTLEWSSSVKGMTADYTNPKIYVNGKNNVIGTATLTGESTWKYGVLYNFAAASAGSITGSSNSSATSQDICPKGWRLPTGGSSGEYVALDKALGGTGANGQSGTAVTNMRNALHLPLSGYFNDGSLYNQGSYGRFWSSTASNTTNRYRLYVDASNLYPQNGSNRQNGFSVRCVAP